MSEYLKVMKIQNLEENTGTLDLFGLFLTLQYISKS